MIVNSGVNFLIVRLANLVGRTQNGSQLIPALVEQIKQGQVTVFAQAVRDLLDVDDFASILVWLLAADVMNDTLLVASGQSIAVGEIVRELEQLLGCEAQLSLRHEGDQQRFDVSKLRAILPDIELPSPDYYRRVLAKYVQHAHEQA